MARPKNIESPEILWNYFISYKKSVKENPLKIHDFVGKDALEVERKKEKPLTFEGFENWLDDNDIIHGLTNYFANSHGAYTEFSSVCSRIRRNIRQDQIEGGMAGIYNPSITQRLNGLVEKSEVTEIKEQPLF